MTMRDLHLDFRLLFDTAEDQEDSEDILLWVMGINARLNKMHLRKNPDTLPLYSAKVDYTPPDQADGRPPLNRAKLKKFLSVARELGADPETALMMVRLLKGIEIFLDIPGLYRRGKGDCNELVPVRVAELWRANIAASPYLIKYPNAKGGLTYHAVVQWPDGSSEDPSLILGMGGPERADERREEIRKQAERWANHLAAAKHLISAEGASPEQLGQQIDRMGLFPRDGVFRSPYPRLNWAGREAEHVGLRRAA
jgi:hypothetical protein